MAAASLSMFAVPALASSYGSCVDAGPISVFSYTDRGGGGTYYVRNVRASIQVSNPSTEFRPCTWSTGNDGASGWVAIVPGALNSHNGQASAILQVGIIACNSYWLSACWNTQDRFFWAEGGCGLSLPDQQDLGPANTAGHLYEIRHYSDNSYSLRIDSVSKLRFVATTHTDVSCWIGGDDKGQWAFERNDRGDGIGDMGLYSSLYSAYDMHGDPGDSGVWVNPGFAFCSATPTTYPGKGSCVYGSDYLRAWDLNSP
jgi:hypothetical protein